MPIKAPWEYEVVLEFISSTPVSAASSKDGRLVLVDFASNADPSKALRLGVPAERIEDFVAALRAVQKALADPASGIHIQQHH